MGDSGFVMFGRGAEGRRSVMKRFTLAIGLAAALMGCRTEVSKPQEATVEELKLKIVNAAAKADELLTSIDATKVQAVEAEYALKKADAARLKLYREELAPILQTLEGAREAEETGRDLIVGGPDHRGGEGVPVPREANGTVAGPRETV